MNGDKSDCRWFNLLALCQVCHLQIQAKVDPRRPYLWEHQEWFKVYAAGFYAHWYGKVELERIEVEAEIDRWLKVGQPWLFEGDVGDDPEDDDDEDDWSELECGS